MKKILLFLLVGMIFLVSCTVDNEIKVIKKLEKNFDKHIGYQTETEIKTIMDNKESIYRMKEKYIKGKKYKLEVLEPEESKGITIEYEDDKIFLNHASIKQSISLKTVKNLNKSLLIGELFEDLLSIKSIKEDKIDDEKYYVIRYKVTPKNKYSDEQIIWLKKKDFTPYMMNIIDKDKNVRVIIKYKNFKFLKENSI